MEKKLTRNIPNKMIAGVAAGLADYLGIDATVARLLFVLATFFHGSGLLVYIILWIAMPAQREAPTGIASPEPPLQNPALSTNSTKTAEAPGSRSAAIIGWILVGLGVFFLMDEFLYPWFHDLFYWFNIRRIWPIIFIIVGILIISSASKKPGTGHAPGESPPASPPANPETGKPHAPGPSSPGQPIAPDQPAGIDKSDAAGKPGAPNKPEVPEEPRTPDEPAGPENPNKS